MKDEYDFSNAKRGPVISLPEHQTEVRLRLDNEVLEWLTERVNEMGGGNYQDMLNAILRAHIQGKEVSAFVQAVRESEQPINVSNEEVFAVLPGRK